MSGGIRDTESGGASEQADDTALDAQLTVLVNRIIRKDREALAELFSLYRPRLWRMVNFRLHPRLQGRLDADDVLQDAYLRAVDRIDYFLRDAAHSSFIWFRMIVEQTLIDLQRRHLGTAKRDATRDYSLGGSGGGDSSSSSLALFLAAQLTSPSSALGRVELARQLDVALDGMNPIDREVLVLRHFEELSNGEVARVLQMSEQAASVRYIRALAKLKKILEVFPDALQHIARE